MANSLREVKVRITSTKNTAQITKAMYMVSQSKVKRAESNYKKYKDFMNNITSCVSQIVEKAKEDYKHPLLTKRAVKKTSYLLITSDRGLAGSYNSGLFKAFKEYVKENHKSKDEFNVSSIGKKGFGFIEKEGYHTIQKAPTLVRDDVMFIDIHPLAKSIIDSYLNEEIDKLVIIYNHYVNSITQEIVFKELLPIDKIDEVNSNVDYIYETGIEETLNLVLPMYVQDIIYGIILDAKTSEHSARMNSMKNATDNATEIIDKLQLLYNRARQDVITTELIDIIGGANAIGGES